MTTIGHTRRTMCVRYRIDEDQHLWIITPARQDVSRDFEVLAGQVRTVRNAKGKIIITYESAATGQICTLEGCR
jgi:hypothetical protein